MIHPPRSESHYRQHSLHIRRPARPRIGTVGAQPQDNSLTTAVSNKASHFMNWITGNAPVPGYLSLAPEEALDANTIQRIEDLRTVLNKHKPARGKWQLMVKDNLNIPDDMHWREQKRSAQQLVQNGTTEFFLNLGDERNLPDHITQKYCNTDDDANFAMDDGIKFMVPTRLLPQDFHSNNNKNIKSWLGLNPDVNFHLWGNRKDVIA